MGETRITCKGPPGTAETAEVDPLPF
jgi:hypothetical protein